MSDLDLKDIVDDGTTDVNVRHIIRGRGYPTLGMQSRGQDVCLEYFGKQDDECLKYNAGQ